MRSICSILLISISHLAMAQQSYLALGDSYTIGEGLDVSKSWPHQLVNQLNDKGFNFNTPEIIATTGWRTDELIHSIEKRLEDDQQFDLVSLLIGVNNQYQEKSFNKYKREFKKLLKESISRSKTGHKAVFVVSIPDYSVTPYAEENDKTEAIKDLIVYNAYAQKLCKKYDVTFYDITKLSAQLSQNIDMLNEDKLHPSEKQYKTWIDSFLPQLINQIQLLQH